MKQYDISPKVRFFYIDKKKKRNKNMLSYFFIFLHISSYFFIFLHIRKYDFIFIDIYSCSTWALLFFLFFGAHCRFRRGGRAFLPFFFIPAAAPTANAAAPAHSAVGLQPPPIRKPPPTPSTWHWHQEKWSFIRKVRFKNWESPKTRNNLTLGSLRKIGTVRKLEITWLWGHFEFAVFSHYSN